MTVFYAIIVAMCFISFLLGRMSTLEIVSCHCSKAEELHFSPPVDAVKCPNSNVTTGMASGKASLAGTINTDKADKKKAEKNLETLSSNNPSLGDILKKSGSDKFSVHHYEHWYEPWLEPFRSVPDLNFLEIGVLKGASLQAWSEYFTSPECQIVGLGYGIPINIKMKLRKELTSNQKFIEGDQSQNKTMQTLRELGPFDVILDDGSHIPSHMIFTLFSLWETSVKPGGLYIIEDLETNYWKNGSEIYGYVLEGTGFGVSAATSAVEKLKQLVDILPRYQLGHRDISVMPGDHSLCSIEFGYNTVKLRKCTKHEMDNRPNFNPTHSIRSQSPTWKEWLRQARLTNPAIDSSPRDERQDS